MSTMNLHLVCAALLLSAVALSGGCIAAPEEEGEAQLDQSLSVLAVPDPPATLTATLTECYGWNSVDWSASANTAYYALYKSTSPTFAGATLVYDGPNTFASVNVLTNPGYLHLRVKACNVEGCSVYSVQETAGRFRTCN